MRPVRRSISVSQMRNASGGVSTARSTLTGVSVPISSSGCVASDWRVSGATAQPACCDLRIDSSCVPIWAVLTVCAPVLASISGSTTTALDSRTELAPGHRRTVGRPRGLPTSSKRTGGGATNVLRVAHCLGGTRRRCHRCRRGGGLCADDSRRRARRRRGRGRSGRCRRGEGRGVAAGQQGRSRDHEQEGQTSAESCSAWQPQGSLADRRSAAGIGGVGQRRRRSRRISASSAASSVSACDALQGAVARRQSVGHRRVDRHVGRATADMGVLLAPPCRRPRCPSGSSPNRNHA